MTSIYNLTVSTIDRSTIYEDAFTYDQIHSPLAEGKSLEFYKSLSKGKSVLEIACGSGRLTIPLALDGVNITGLDLSASMLKKAKEKSRESGVSIDWIQADCTKFALDQKFDLIFMTGNSLQHLKTAELVHAYFDCVKRHLSEGGIFAFDIFRPSLSILTRDPDTRHFLMRYKNKNGEDVLLEESNRYDQISQINLIHWFHIVSGKLQKTDLLEMRQFFPQEINALLHSSGFKILQSFGDWDGNPISDQNFKQIIVARPVV